MSHLSLDARAILHYLNELGYRNISATQLKEFLKDLRKLIKYEERMGVNTQQQDYYESLFRRTTASYRAKFDGENNENRADKRKSFACEPACNRQTAIASRKVLSERNYGETANSSNELLSSHSDKQQEEKKVKEYKINRESLKTLIEQILGEVLRDKHSQNIVVKDQHISSNGRSYIKSVVEQVLQDKLSDLRHPARYGKNSKSSAPQSLAEIIQEVAMQVLQEKLSNIEKQSEKFEKDNDLVTNLEQDLQQKLSVSKKQNTNLPREHITHYNGNRPLDSQSLLQQLLDTECVDNKNDQQKNISKCKADKENSNTPNASGDIKRLKRSPRKRMEWKDPSVHDKILDKPMKPIRCQSPAVSSSTRSGRSKCSSSVLIQRSKSQGRKPNSDPVALYQYYKNEWDHFRKQIPGETSHSRLRWHVRQRFLDPE